MGLPSIMTPPPTFDLKVYMNEWMMSKVLPLLFGHEGPDCVILHFQGGSTSSFKAVCFEITLVFQTRGFIFQFVWVQRGHWWKLLPDWKNTLVFVPFLYNLHRGAMIFCLSKAGDVTLLDWCTFILHVYREYHKAQNTLLLFICLFDKNSVHFKFKLLTFMTLNTFKFWEYIFYISTSCIIFPILNS